MNTEFPGARRRAFRTLQLRAAACCAAACIATPLTAGAAPSGAFNFAFVPFNDPAVQSGKLAVRQHGTGNAAADVEVSLEGSSPELHVLDAETNRGDYAIFIGDKVEDDVESGTLIASIRNDGRDHGQGQGVQYGSIAIDVSGAGHYYLALSEYPSGAEYNADAAVAHFPYDQFTAGYARNSVNNGPITELYSSANIRLGGNFTTLDSGVYRLSLPGVNALSDGVLLATGGRNDDNNSITRPLDDGSGFLIGVRDNGNDGARFEADGVSFVYLEKGDTHLVFGRAMSDGSTPVSNGNFVLRRTGVGKYRLTIPGYSPAQGTLLVSSEGFDLRNQDNFVSYREDAEGWTIQTRDVTSRQLQDAGERFYPTALDALPPLPQVERGAPRPMAETLAIWQDASIPYTMVAAHRAGYYEQGRTRWPENSIAAIEEAIALGVDMVELDVAKTADGKYVLMHDATVDRTTTGTGRVDGLTLPELQSLSLVIEDTREVTNERVPTLAEGLAAARDRILVNLDVKLPITDFAAILDQARGLGVENQVVIKSAVDTHEQIAQVQATLAALPYPVEFMPIMRGNAVRDIDFVRTVFEAFRPNALEAIVRPAADDLVSDGGFMFSPAMRALAAEFDVRLWINTLYSGPYAHGGDLNGLRSDYLALVGHPDKVYRFWAEQGAGVVQTDESQLAVGHLQQGGARPSLIRGSDGDDRLQGTSGRDVLLPLAGRIDVMTGGAGADVFKFGPELANGQRETRYITDYEAGVDSIDLGTANVVESRATASSVILFVGEDRDMITVAGVDSINQISID